MEWYYAADGERHGPVEQAELEALVAQGVIGPSTLVWHAGMADWQPWERVGGGAAGGMSEVAATVAVQLSKVPEAQLVAGMALAGFGPRLGAKLLDWVVVYLPLSFVFSMSGIVLDVVQQANGDGQPTFNSYDVTFLAFSSIMPRVFFFAYQAYCYAKWGATLGKRMLGLRVVDASGEPLSVGQAVGRAASEVLTGLTCLVGYLVMLLDKEERTLHDFMAGTRVVRAPKVEETAPAGG